MCQIPPKEGKTTKFWKDIKVVSAFQKSSCNCVVHTALDWQQLQKADFAAVSGWHWNHVSAYFIFKRYLEGKKADSKAEEFCIAIPAKEYNFFKCLCWKKIISLPESVSFTELRFSSHGFMDHIALPYLFFLKEQLLFHSQVCQSLISGCFHRKWGFFPRNCILKR